eukprot:scaffold331_cov117-Cylindrotheca_fusiformis.AAC.13
MGTEASRPLAPPVDWERNNQAELHIVSPANTHEVANGFQIISPISDLSNPSDVLGLQNPTEASSGNNGQRGRGRGHNCFSHSANHSLEQANSKRRGSSGKRVSKSHRRMESFSKVFGCFAETSKLREEARNSAAQDRRNLIEI